MDNFNNSVFDNFVNLQKKLEKGSCQSGAKKNKDMYIDWAVLSKLLKDFNIESNSEFFLQHYDNRDLANYKLIFDYNAINVCSNIMDIYKQSNFSTFDGDISFRLSDKDCFSIICDFFDYFLPNGSKYFSDNLKNKKILLTDNSDFALGCTFPFKSLNDCYIFVNVNSIDCAVQYMSTFIHELMHKYCFDASLRSTRLKDILTYTPLTEVISLYSEFSFYNYLRENHILSKTNEFYLNLIYEYYLNLFEERFAILYSLFDGGILNYKDNDIFNVFPRNDNEYIYKDDNPLYSIKSNKIKGSVYDFNYLVGFIKSMDLLKRELNGENIKKMIDDTIYEFHTDECAERYFYDESNYDFLKDQIKLNTNNCKKLYKIK